MKSIGTLMVIFSINCLLQAQSVLEVEKNAVTLGNFANKALQEIGVENHAFLNYMV